MALLFWLPMTDGTSLNQGVADTTITDTNIVVNNTGKLGKCCEFNATDSQILLSGYDFTSALSNDFSVAFWVYDNRNGARTCYITTYGMGTGNSGIAIEKTAAQKFRFWYYSGSSSSSIDPSISVDVEDQTWIHFAIVKSGTTATLYKNGVQVWQNSYNNYSAFPENKTKLAIGNDTRGATNGFIGKLNDVRIYNTAISPRLVKLLSQGLVVHYPLDHDGVGGDNLLTNSSFSKNLTGWTASGTNNGIVLQDGYRCLHIPGALKTTKFIRQNIASAISDKSTDQSYTISADIRVDNIVRGTTNPMCEFYFGGSYDNNGTSAWLGATYISGTKEFYDLSNTGWHRLYVVVRFAHVPTNMDAYIYIRDITGDVYIKNIKFELGDTATPWCPNSADTQYAELGLNSDIEYDVSGYGYNATKMGELTYKSVSPKYVGCTHMGATNQKIHISDLQTSGFSNSYTFSWWGKRSSNTPMFWGFSNGIRLNGMYTGSLWNTGDGQKNPLYNIGTTTQVTGPSVNVWHHYAMTGNGTKCYVYLDGELWAEAKTYKSISGTSIYINGWDNSTSYASDDMDIVDFRIYATALSADDVAELYHTPISLANDGTLFAAQFVES